MFFCTVILTELCAVLCAFVTFNNKVLFDWFDNLTCSNSEKLTSWTNITIIIAVDVDYYTGYYQEFEDSEFFVELGGNKVEYFVLVFTCRRSVTASTHVQQLG